MLKPQEAAPGSGRPALLGPFPARALGRFVLTARQLCSSGTSPVTLPTLFSPQPALSSWCASSSYSTCTSAARGHSPVVSQFFLFNWVVSSSWQGLLLHVFPVICSVVWGMQPGLGKNYLVDCRWMVISLSAFGITVSRRWGNREEATSSWVQNLKWTQ